MTFLLWYVLTSDQCYSCQPPGLDDMPLPDDGFRGEQPVPYQQPPSNQGSVTGGSHAEMRQGNWGMSYIGPKFFSSYSELVITTKATARNVFMDMSL